MIIGIPRESLHGETRVAATPQTVGQLIKLGYSVLVESGAGAAASFSDAAFAEAGADIGSSDQVLKADVVLKVNAPNREEIAALRDGATLVSLMSPALNPDLVEQLASRPITALAMDAVPRISRAQSLDVLSSMANIAGYRAVDRGGACLRSVLHRAGDRGRQGAASQGAGGRCGCGRIGRHRRGRQSGCHRAGHRPAARGRRPGQIAGRGVSLRRSGGCRGFGHRLRQRDGRRLQGPRGAVVCRAVQGRRHHHHDRADPRQARAPDHHRAPWWRR